MILLLIGDVGLMVNVIECFYVNGGDWFFDFCCCVIFLGLGGIGDCWIFMCDNGWNVCVGVMCVVEVGK